MVWIILGVILGLVIGWAIKSIKIVGPDEMAVRIILGKPVGVDDSGFRFVPFFFGCFLKRFPKKWYNLDYPARKIVSGTGEYHPGTGKTYGAQVLEVDSVAYLRFPKGKDKLVEILRSQVPINHDDLLGWTEESVVGAIRVSLGKITWKEATEDISRARHEADVVFKDKDGVLLKSGFEEDDLRLTIKEIKLPRKLEEALPTVDMARLEAEAAPYKAEQRAVETVGAVVDMFCKLTGMPKENIQQQLKDDPTTFVEKNKDTWDKTWDIVHRRMGIDGKAYVDIRTANPLLDLLAAWRRMPMSSGGPAAGGAGKEVSKEESEEKEESAPGQIQGFWRKKRPMEALHRQKRK